jgi:hypothetical protein
MRSGSIEPEARTFGHHYLPIKRPPARQALIKALLSTCEFRPASRWIFSSGDWYAPIAAVCGATTEPLESTLLGHPGCRRGMAGMGHVRPIPLSLGA